MSKNKRENVTLLKEKNQKKNTIYEYKVRKLNISN